jgi:hypothetical protein
LFLLLSPFLKIELCFLEVLCAGGAVKFVVCCQIQRKAVKFAVCCQIQRKAPVLLVKEAVLVKEKLGIYW